jgi:hypothetical protein
MRAEGRRDPRALPEGAGFRVNRGHVYQMGEDPLAEWPMTPEQVANLVEHVRENQDIGRARSARARWSARSGACIACLKTLDLVDGIVPPHPGVGAYANRCVGSNKPPLSRRDVRPPRATLPPPIRARPAARRVRPGV